MPVRRTSLARPVLEVAPSLLGMVLRRTTDEGTVAVRITEVEAYDGPNDPGSHAYRGQTARNAVMFGPPGFLYVYFTYGMHFCMNISAGPDGQPSAVLLRAGEVTEGLALARSRRGATPPAASTTVKTRRIADRDLARGPARLCVALGITRDANGADLLSRDSAIQLLPGTPFTGSPATGPRVGLREAADRPWRFWIPGEPSVSPYKPHVPKRR
ncbi:DNA-3-methyladenine glycosylase [Kribbella monticola]|uniref:DNA-3-methyladenine glycosylase n=1 Tax=Kribbella monticola TaxID=2185285 RepID=UPI000DD494FD|nr:DNA-3-methyladenine glycosylase [Kribbella monticola]